MKCRPLGRNSFRLAHEAADAGLLKRMVQALAPAELDHTIARCLAKDPEDRWQSARDVKLQLSWIAESPPSRSSPTTKSQSSSERLAWALAGLALVALTVAIVAPLVTRRAPNDERLAATVETWAVNAPNRVGR